MNPKYKPALLGGVLVGVLSGLPGISWGNCCCCMWVVLGGIVVAYLQQQNQPAQIEAADVALNGLIAGALGAVLGFLLAAALDPLMRPINERLALRAIDWAQQMSPNMPPDFRDRMHDQMAQAQGRRVFGAQVFSLMGRIVVFGVFGMLGGLLGRAIFKPKTPPAPQA